MDMDTVNQLGTTVIGASNGALVILGNFLVFIVLTFVVYLFAMRRGGAGIIALNLSLYAGYALYMVFPYRDAVIGIGSTPIMEAIISLILFILATIAPFLIVMRLTAPAFGQLSFFPSAGLSVVAAGFLMALAYHVFDISNIYTFSDPLNQLFAPQGYFFWWFIAPLVGLYFLAR
jgi:hypothetical protein